MDINETREAIKLMEDFIKDGVIQHRKQQSNSTWIDGANPGWNFITYEYRKKRIPQTGYITDYSNEFGRVYHTEADAKIALNTVREGARVIKWIEVLDDE